MSNRIESFGIDIIAIYAICVPLTLIGFAFHDSLIGMSFLISVPYALLFSKDVEGGRSFGKRSAGLCVVLKKDGSIPSTTRLILRNVFYVIWPIEVLLVLCNSGRRLGDLVTQTKIVSCDKETNGRFRLTRKYVRTALIMIVIMFALFYPICRLMYELSPAMRLFYS